MGAAVWLYALYSSDEVADYGLSDPRIEAIVEKFLETADYEFECADIVGRKFEDVADHAGHLHEGGCAEIVDAMAAELAAKSAGAHLQD